jgi:hypothetical protein
MFAIIWLKLLITPMHKLWNITVASNMKCMLPLNMSTKNIKLYVNSLHIYIKIKFHHHFNCILLCSPYTPLHKPLQNYCIFLKFKYVLETNGFDLSWFNLHCYPHHLAPYCIHVHLILNMTLISFTLFKNVNHNQWMISKLLASFSPLNIETNVHINGSKFFIFPHGLLLMVIFTYEVWEMDMYTHFIGQCNSHEFIPILVIWWY